MILSRSRHFIFFKTIKTASTSTEIVLSRHCDEADIITYLPPPDEIIRRQFGGRPAQNHRNPWLKRVFGTLAGWDADHRRYRYHHNISATSLRGMISRTEWEGCTKVTIARNPYDRAVSKYYHDAHHRSAIARVDAKQSADAINQYLLALPDSDLTNWHIYGDRTGVLVDRVMRYEELPEELSRFLESLGVSEPLVMPQAKAGWRPDRRSYRKIIGGELRNRIEEVAAREIELMGYRW